MTDRVISGRDMINLFSDPRSIYMTHICDLFEQMDDEGQDKLIEYAEQLLKEQENR